MRFPLVTENSPFYLFCHGMGKSLTVTNEIVKIIDLFDKSSDRYLLRKVNLTVVIVYMIW